jgi:hypothetical protein
MTNNWAQSIKQITADEYWQRLEAIGWLDHAQLAFASHEELRHQIEAVFARDPWYVWTLLGTIHFDAECIYETGPAGLSYHAQLAQLVEDSRGVFQPTMISDAQVDNTIEVSFEHHGQTYSYTARLDSDYFDEAVIDLINEALADAGVAERFMILPTIDQCIQIAVVPEAIYQAAVQNNLIPGEPMLRDNMF